MMSRNETSSAGPGNRYGDGGLSSSSAGDEFRLLLLSSTETSVEEVEWPRLRDASQPST